MSSHSIASVKAANVVSKPSATQSARPKTSVKSASTDTDSIKTKPTSDSISISDAGKAALQKEMKTDNSESADSQQ